MDGVIQSGVTEVDESIITGESLLKEKKIGDLVIAGSINGSGLIHVKVTRLQNETMLSKIITLVENAQGQKAPIQKLVDKVSSYFVPTVIVIALITFILSGFIIGDWYVAMYRAVSVLVIACPCALGIATPTTILVGTGAAAKLGILIRNTSALELGKKINLVVFDKTGTLTKGAPSVSHVEIFSGDKNQVLSIMGSIQSGSEHPLARALLDYLKVLNISFKPSLNTQSLPGLGLSSLIENKKYYFGNKKLILSLTASYEKIFNMAQVQEDLGETVSYLFDKDKSEILAYITFSDAIKPESKMAIEALKKVNIKSMIVSGDNFGSVERVANALEISSFKSESLPQDKSDIINELKRTGHFVAMVGDGVNDAPGLAASDLAISVSGATDVATNTSHISLLNPSPMLTYQAIVLCQMTYDKIRQNLFWAFIYNIIGIPLAAFGFLNPMLAALGMGMSSVSVVMNSLLLKKQLKNL